jgi:hypothetical protein
MTDRQGEAAADRHRAVATFALHRSAGTHAWVQAAGTSMSPLICPGDRLYIQFGSVRPRLGEIVVFPESRCVVAHRLVRRRRTEEGEMLVTRGDHSVGLDRPFSADQALGVVRACRQARDGAPVALIDDGSRAIVVACISAATGYLLLGVDRLPAWLARPAARIVVRLGPAIVTRSVRTAAWSARGSNAARLAGQPDLDLASGPVGGSLPTVE